MNLHKILVKTGRYYDKRYSKFKSTSDQIICEYPKSGVTYLSCLLANFYNTNIEANYYNINQIVEDRHFKSYHHDFFVIPNLLKLKKSHFEYTKSYTNVIHLFRNPIDSLISYFNYLNSFSKYHQNDFEKFVFSRRGIDRWNSHTMSYLKVGNTIRYIPISYERLVENPRQFLKTHSYLLGVEGLYDKNIDQAIFKSSKDYMLDFEKKYMSGGKVISQDDLFIGIKKFKKKDVKASLLKEINNLTHKTYLKAKEVEENFFSNF